MSPTADARPEPFSRRREVAATSARSLLLTVLGELVLPGGHPVWTQTLLDALGTVGVEPKAARQALARTAADGVVDSTRAGRRVRWSLSESGHRLLREGAERIYSHGAPRADWDGRWLVLVVSVPEAQRRLRHRLRTRLAWAGLGSPTPGVWVSPDAGRLDEARDALRRVDLLDAAFVVVGTSPAGLPAVDLVAQAWDLTDLESRYERFVARFDELDPDGGDATLAAQIRLVDDWRRFPFLDPQLPAALLPEHWAGHRAAEIFHDRHVAWRAESRRRFAELDAG